MERESVAPGDVKYVDVNQDGVIDDYDMVPIGYTPVPEIIYGFSFGAQYKGFDFSILFQGADMYPLNISDGRCGLSRKEKRVRNL